MAGPSTTSAAGGRWSLLPSTTVAVRYRGLVLLPPARGTDHGTGRQPGLADLALLVHLAAHPDTSEAEAIAALSAAPGQATWTTELRTAFEDLRHRGLLVPDRPPRPAHRSDRPWAPSHPVAPIPDDQPLQLVVPLLLAPDPDGFVGYDLDGRRTIALRPHELLAAAAFAQPASVDEALAADGVVTAGLDRTALGGLVERLRSRGLLRPATDGAAVVQQERARQSLRTVVAQTMRLRRSVARQLAELDAAEAEREAATGATRVPVVPINHHSKYVPLGLGMILSSILAAGEATERHYVVRPDWSSGERTPEQLTRRPGVFLFSSYLWSHTKNLATSAAIKAVSPGSLTIHGGPDTPAYPADTEAYLRENPHVDVVVHGEGERTAVEVLAALAGTVGGPGPVDLAPLRDVPGISFVLDGEVVRTPPRERLADLNVIPSPFLAGVFDAYRDVPELNVILETNRGCPYGCTYCDWGSATMARIRKLDLDRVLAELEWCATAKAQSIAFADANFGIFERDVEIARRVVELKAEHGFPLACTGSYAKNTVKHLQEIISTWADAGMLTMGVLSLQTMDEATLEAVHRKNIRTEKYDELAREFRRSRLPLFVDLMVGLPGMTLASFVDDLQSCIDREVQAKVHRTELLPNSPMNEPAYRAEHGIQIRRPGTPGSAERNPLVTATATMSTADLQFAERLRPVYLLAENFGILRHVARYLRHETGLREVDLYLRIVALVDEERTRWPAFDLLTSSTASLLAPPISWWLLFEEVRTLAVEQLGVADDAALQVVLDVNRAVLPSQGRPERVELALPHDYASWHRQLVEAKLDGEDVTTAVPPLRTFGPAQFVAEDPLRLSDTMLGMALDAAWFDSWDLVSPVARPSTLGSGLAAVGDERPAPEPQPS